MVEDFRHWIRRHWNVVISFLIGVTCGISILALAFFSTRAEIAGHLFRYGVQATGHPDLDEDLIWLFCGIVIGGSVACLAWWRDTRTRTIGLHEADVLNRLFAEPDVNPLRTRKIAGKGSGE
jgi:H+/Cl- antiporter ClcA